MAKTATQSIEDTLLEATGEKPQAKGETRNDYLLRLAKAANKLPEADFDSLPKPVQDWWNEFATARQEKKSFPDFPDAEDSDEDDEDSEEDGDAPPKRQSKAVDPDEEDDENSEDDDPAEDDDSDDDEPEDDEESEDDSDDESDSDDDDADDEDSEEEDDEPVAKAKPSSKRQALDDDEEDDTPPPVKRGPGRPKGSTSKPKPSADEDGEEAPKRKPGRPKGSTSKPKAAKEDDEDTAEPKKSVRPRLNELVVKNPNRDREKLHALLTKEGFDVKPSSVNVMFYEVIKVIKELARQGGLSKEYASQLVKGE